MREYLAMCTVLALALLWLYFGVIGVIMALLLFPSSKSKNLHLLFLNF